MSAVPYRRVILQGDAIEVFLYAAHLPGANCIEIGVGYESMGGLQRKHIATHNIHHLNVEYDAEIVRMGGMVLRTGALKDHTYFEGRMQFHVNQEQANALADAMIDLCKEVWPQ